MPDCNLKDPCKLKREGQQSQRRCDEGSGGYTDVITGFKDGRGP